MIFKNSSLFATVLLASAMQIRSADAAVQVVPDATGELYTVTGCSEVTSAALSSYTYTAGNGDEVTKINISKLDQNDEDATWIKVILRKRPDETLYLMVIEGNSASPIVNIITTTSAATQILDEDPTLLSDTVNQHLLAVLAGEIGIEFDGSHGAALSAVLLTLLAC